MIHILVWLASCFLFAAAAAALLSVVFSVLAVPFVLLHDFTQWLNGNTLKQRIKKAEKIADDNERLLNEYYYRKEFGNDVPKSGTLDSNGIPYL